MNVGEQMKSFIKMILQVVRRLDYICLYVYFAIRYPINDKQILFLSDSRETMTGNFYFISCSLDNSYTIKKHLYADAHIKHAKKNICKDMATSHYIIIDDFCSYIYPIPLRKKTKLIQVWHAMGAFKTVGFARKGNHDRFSMTHRNYTDTIVSAPSIRKDYAKAFRMDMKNVHSIGIPRTDIFFNQDYISKKRKDIYLRYPMLKDKKVILFAPTFRGNNIHKAYYDFEKINFRELQERLPDNYMCIIKMHPFIQNTYLEELDSSFYLDLTHEREINDLLLITDILITDYSSVIFEASLLNIHTLFYAYDLLEYTETRDFFYPYEEYTFGPVVYNEEELVNAILYSHINEEKLMRFKEKFTICCDGKATQRFIDTLLKEK